MEKRAGSDAIHLERGHPGCMWGILHVLKYNRWRYAKQRLLHKRFDSVKHSSDSGNGSVGCESDDEKDKPRKRGQHHRSSSYPQSRDSVHQIESCGDGGEEQEQTNPNDKTDINDHEIHERNDGFAPVILPRLKVDHRSNNNNWTAIKRFKNIGNKIKHLMVFDKKEKRRIAMDGVLDKIPKDHQGGIGDEVKKEVIRKWRECAFKINNNNNNNQDGSKQNVFKRTPSLNESMDKYRQLLESFNNETKHDIDTDGLKLKRQHTRLSDDDSEKRSLSRIRSLPNIDYFSLKIEDDASDGARSESRTNVKENVNLGLRFQQLLDTYIESETKDDSEEHVKPTELETDFEATPVPELDTVCGEIIDKSAGLPVTKDMEIEESGTFEIDAPDSKLTIEEQEDSGVVQRGRMGDAIQVKSRDVELFNFVRDVLELSGFGDSKFLKVWPSDDQPLDPSMVEEVGGRNLLRDPKCCGNYEGDHLHTFDLINEELVDIHQRSITYWPVPLTSHCHVHPMPFGHHVLEQVWASISSYLSLKHDHDPTLDYIVSIELEKRDGWMNLQFESECVGLELEELVFEDILDELMFDDLLEELMWT